MSQNPLLSTLATSVIVAFTGGTAALLLAVMLSNRVTAWMSRLERIPMSGIVIRCLDALGRYRNRPGALLAGLCISLPAHLLACVGVYIAMSTVHAPIVSLESFLLAVPLGLITTTIPISPAGVGISQAAFYTLFTAIAPGSGSAASNAFTVYQTMQILVFLTGFVSYFAEGTKVRTEAAEVA